MGKIVRILIILAAIIGLLFLFKNTIIRVAVEKGVETATGLPMKIGKFDLSFTNSQVGIWGLELLNPSGFPDKVMFHAPEIFVDYHLGDTIRGNIHLEDMRLNFDQLTIIKNAQGKMNIDTLKPQKQEQQSKGESQGTKKGEAGQKIPDIQIDHLSLKVGKVVYKDYSQGGEPAVQEYNVNISEEFKDIKDVQGLVGAIVSRTVSKTALSSLVDINVDMLQDATAIPISAVEMLKGAADSITETIKLPFGQ
ncbi:MAG: hypothetical protein A3C36_00555 [Omnitrophica WOR_2 bacterium RIFCSPHIGHO2_02_FULL_52_10]|nr:MAG: hypothetical protein A3C36_00555 [Omnitrophica WOR_2 bacterium RIFCSPHIGHO2_02_FULL_52_10]